MGRLLPKRNLLSTTVLLDQKVATEVNPKYTPVIAPAIITLGTRQSYRVVLTRNEDGWMTAQCVEIPGAISQGKDIPDALKNIAEALTGVLEATSPEQAENIVISWVEKKVTA